MFNQFLLFNFIFIYFATVSAQVELVLPKQFISMSLEGGISIAHTDYVNQEIGPAFRSSLAYYLQTGRNQKLGFGLQIGFQQLRGSDDRFTISTIYGLRELSPTFSTNIISPGLFLDYGYSFTERFSTFIKLCATYNVFNPKDNNGQDALAYKSGLYKKDFFTFVPEVGIGFRINKNLSFSFSLNYAIAVTDNLDDISASLNKDSYTNLVFGFSYLFAQHDNEEDRLLDDISNYTDVKSRRDILADKKKDIKLLPFEEALDLNQDIREIFLPADKTFEDGTSRFKADIFEELDKITELIIRSTDSRWRIEGHMNKLEDYEQAKNLSQERAKAVYDYFISKGINPSTLKYYGLSSRLPIADNDTEEGRMLNRRIMIIKETDFSDVAKKKGLPYDSLNTYPLSHSDSLAIEETKTYDNTQSESQDLISQFFLRGDDTFEINSDVILEIAKILLNEIVHYIKSFPESKWRIEGHTDNQGSASQNLKLSTDRAKAIYNYFLEKGISSEQLTFKGFGRSAPLVDNITEESRKVNRRVLIIREK